MRHFVAGAHGGDAATHFVSIGQEDSAAEDLGASFHQGLLIFAALLSQRARAKVYMALDAAS